MHYSISTRKKASFKLNWELKRFLSTQALKIKYFFIVFMLKLSVDVKCLNKWWQIRHRMRERPSEIIINWSKNSHITLNLASFFLIHLRSLNFVYVLFLILSSKKVCCHHCWNCILIKNVQRIYVNSSICKIEYLRVITSAASCKCCCLFA